MRYSVKQTVLNLTANALFQKACEIPAVSVSALPETAAEDTFDASEQEAFWKAVLAECKAQSIPALTASVLPQPEGQSGAYQAVWQQWTQLSYACLAQNVRVIDGHRKVHELMQANHIPYVILKGCASAAFYPDPCLRSMGDVDFLVAWEDMERAGQVLEEAGYHGSGSMDLADHHLSYKKDGIHLELHFALNGIPEDVSGDLVREELADLIEKAQPQPGTGILLPCDYHHGLIILLHNAHHMVRSGMGLRHLCDWAAFVDHMGDGFQAVFEQPLKATGLWEYACILTAVSTRSIGLSPQSWCKTYPEDFLQEVLDDIFGCGNFGRKLKGTSSHLFLQNTNGQSRNAGVAQSSLKTVNRITATHWPMAKKCPLLYPAGWVFFSARYGVKVLQGKRKKFRVKDSVSLAKQRNRVYQELHLFETQEVKR